MENKTDMKHGFLSRIPRRAAAALALALLMILPAQALGDIEVRYLLQGMGALAPVPGTQYLLAQEQGGDLWGVYNTSGDKLINCQFDRLTYLNHGWFQDALGDDNGTPAAPEGQHRQRRAERFAFPLRGRQSVSGG